MDWRTYGRFAEMVIKGLAQPADFTFSIAAGASNISEITIQAKRADGSNLAGIRNILVWLSDAATGLDITSTSASGAVTAKAASGEDLGPLTAKKCFMGQTDATGKLIVSITDTAKTTFYVCLQTPSGAPKVSRILATADYG